MSGLSASKLTLRTGNRSWTTELWIGVSHPDRPTRAPRDQRESALAQGAAADGERRTHQPDHGQPPD